MGRISNRLQLRLDNIVSSGGVRPEDLAAGISRLSVIEEVQVLPTPATLASTEVDIKVTMEDGSAEKKPAVAAEQEGQSDLRDYP